MDPQLYEDFSQRKVAFYQDMMDKGASVLRVSFILGLTLKELAPKCERYRELSAWAKQKNLAPEEDIDWCALADE